MSGRMGRTEGGKEEGEETHEDPGQAVKGENDPDQVIDLSPDRLSESLSFLARVNE
jgi:hypothetical protein